MRKGLFFFARLGCALCPLALSLLLLSACQAHPAWAVWLGRNLLAPCFGVLGRLSALCPFPVCIVVAAALFLFAAVCLARRRWFCLFAVACTLAAALIGGWGVLCQQPALTLPLQAQSSSGGLLALCQTLAAQAEQNACEPPQEIFSLVPHALDAALDDLRAQGIDTPLGSFAAPRASRMSGLFSHLLIEGMFIPFTGEALVNEAMPACCLPFVACHEAAHARGFAREEDANLLAYLACSASQEPYFRFSGAVCALSFAMDALRETDAAAHAALYDALPERVRQALEDRSAFWQPYRRTRAAAISVSINESYLNTLGSQQEGIASYGGFVETLLKIQ